VVSKVEVVEDKVAAARAEEDKIIICRFAN